MFCLKEEFGDGFLKICMPEPQITAFSMARLSISLCLFKEFLSSFGKTKSEENSPLSVYIFLLMLRKNAYTL